MTGTLHLHVPNSLEPGVIQIHPMKLDASEEVVGAFKRFLCLEERERAQRFRYPWLKQRFILARGALRLFIAKYIDARPEEIHFEYGEQGKPRIRDRSLQFNISHSESIALMAFSRECELGVDVEIIRPKEDLEGIAERFFHPEEVAALQSLPPDARQQAFYICWTRKEAYLKASGHGLSIPLDSFRVTLDADSPRIVRTKAEPHPTCAYSLCDLSSPPDYAAALAYCGNALRVATAPFTDLEQMMEELLS